jgi:hypothetical protein
MVIAAKRMYMSLFKNFWHRFMKFFRDENVPMKRQGARVKIRRKSWLKQLRVAISTRASVPSGSSPQNSQTKFVDLHHITCDFKTRENFSKVQMIKTSAKHKNFLNLLRNFHAKRQGGEGVGNQMLVSLRGGGGELGNLKP